MLHRILIFSRPYDEMKKAVEEKSAGELDLLCNTGSNKSKCDEMFRVRNLIWICLQDDFPRLDAFLTSRAKISRTRAHKLIRSHVVLVNSEIATKISMKLRNKDVISILGLEENETLQAGRLIISS